ncbi:TonB-dependent receptor [Massilia sp. GCM10020059]|uniref:TonB-dependent receptor n=1 Tax=Massilia agrisoli TaxID=2892444 RepID=A0ABS8IST4_9BURK|nr:TonB-dependent receptor [Massilia agrisoli]MCC6070768.1 TonB-dependent receptor [Massilia agrisoli]
MKRTCLSLSILLAFGGASTASHAAETAAAGIPTVVISAKLLESYPYRMEASSDSAGLLASTPGFATAASGGVSGFPVVNGLGDDRLKIRIGAMEVTAACANHMNPPMSYIDPKQVQAIELTAGVTPVSNGGDNIGGTINISTATPVFAKPGAGLRTEGSVSLTTRSVNNTISVGASGAVASEQFSFSFDGARAKADSYKDGSGRTILASMYKSTNLGVTLGYRQDGHRLTLRAGTQEIPYQGFPNQYMDMTDNTANHASLAYEGQYDWGQLDATTYWQQTDHKMGFFTPERTGKMPMVTEGRDRGYTIRATLPLGGEQLMRFGHEYHRFALQDYWPAVAGSAMMGPQTYVNINDGERTRLALYAEVVNHFGQEWITQLGARTERVHTDAGDVQAYANNMMNAADAAAATAFNARSRRQSDANLDLTATARYQPGPGFDLDFGFGRKTRSPNLYERYAWGRGVMAMTMTNWFGDGNGYVGNIDLKPESANTLSATVHWHGTERDSWFVKLAPYYNRVSDYIDVDTVGSFNPYKSAQAKGALLRFANHDATLYGANLSWKAPIARTALLGELNLTGNASLTRGKRNDEGVLYRMMPPNMLLALEQRDGPWNSQLEVKAVAAKDRVDQRRLEPRTAGYALLNARTAYQWKNGLLLTLGISNLLDKTYSDPLGGVYLTGLAADKGALTSLTAPGRSFDIGASLRF